MKTTKSRCIGIRKRDGVAIRLMKLETREYYDAPVVRIPTGVVYSLRNGYACTMDGKFK